MPPKTKYIEGFTAKNKKGQRFSIIERFQGKKARIRFHDTGYEKVINTDTIRNGNIKDCMQPSFCGVGYIGDGIYSHGSHKRILEIWARMLNRCYNQNDSNYKTYGAIGVRVCDEWHNFQEYCKWYETNYPGPGFDVDKDMLSGDIKIYSPQTCQFIPHRRNSEISIAKSYLFASPEGEEFRIFNMRKFCMERELTASRMYQVALGNQSNHKGWTSLEREAER